MEAENLQVPNIPACLRSCDATLYPRNSAWSEQLFPEATNKTPNKPSNNFRNGMWHFVAVFRRIFSN